MKLNLARRPVCRGSGHSLLGALGVGAFLCAAGHAGAVENLRHPLPALLAAGDTAAWGVAVVSVVAAIAAVVWGLLMRRTTLRQTELAREQLKRETVFSSLSQRLSTATTLEQAAQTVIDAGDELIGWDACYARLFTPDGLRTVPLIHYDIIDGKRARDSAPPLTLDVSARDRRIMEKGAEMILRPAQAETGPGFIPFGDRGRPSASLMYVPVRKGARVMGLISLQSYTPNAYVEGDLRVLQNLADLSGATFERILAEQALKDSEERFRALFESSPVGIAVSRETGLLYANTAHQRMFGYATFEELKGRSFFDLVALSDHQMVKDRIARRREENRATDSYETVGRRKDGSEFFYHVEIAQIKLADGEATVAFLTDVTERKLALDRLRESEERFARIFHATPIAVSVINAATGRLVDVNEAFLRLFVLRRDQAIGATALELDLWVNPADRERMLRHLERHRSLHEYEARFKNSLGDRRNALISVEPIQLSQRECLLFITHDITDRLNLESQLRHSQKMDAIGQLAAGVAHDFNNILTVIQGHMTLLQEAAQYRPDMMESLAEVAAATDRAASLTRQLLTFSRKQVIQTRLLDLNDTVNSTARMLHRLLGENIVIQVTAAELLPVVHGDPGMMEQILVNLAVNARDAMPNGGQLKIDTRKVLVGDQQVRHNPEARPGEFVQLSVTDTGSGMDTATRNRIFEPFFTTKEVGKGTGLGLATVYGIVKQHLGWIEVESDPGKGSTFRVYLPAVPKNRAVPSGLATPAAVAGGSETILVVEDEEALRELVTHVLKRFGYRVLAAEHGRDALRIWEQEADAVQLLLTDMVMPEGLSGWELARVLKERKPGLKVIYTSGYSADLFGENCELREGVNFIAKPFQPQAMAKAVRDCLDA